MLEYVNEIEMGRGHRSFAVQGAMPLGSWRLSVHADREYYTDSLKRHFKQQLGTMPHSGHADVCLYMLEAPDSVFGFTKAAAAMENQAASWQPVRDGIYTLFTGWFRVTVLTRRVPLEVVLLIREPQYTREAFHGHLFEIMHKLLFLFERLYVHAGAVALNDQACMFVGDRGSGKSTVCMRLAQAGPVILSDDHVVVKRSLGKFYVSGCEAYGRVTEKTERELLPRTLDAPLKDYNGLRKKEFRVADFFPCAHYQDHPLKQIFFTRVRDDFLIVPLSPQATTIRLIQTTRPFFRASGKAEFEDYLTYCSELAREVSAFDLTLSQNLETLDELEQFLNEGCE
jgi:hypothetical protein